MARITVEDCLEVVPNRFSLVLVAAERSKQLLKGAQPLIDNMDENKEVVTALREIAAGKFQIDDSGVKSKDTLTSVFLGLAGASAITAVVGFIVAAGGGGGGEHAGLDRAQARAQLALGPTSVQLLGSF